MTKEENYPIATDQSYEINIRHGYVMNMNQDDNSKGILIFKQQKNESAFYEMDD